ncbi:MAG TPA: DUF397 domain-containing protein [Trebonia sp.]|nr:DUF397 domain-containing protein [Trebonia sp.]
MTDQTWRKSRYSGSQANCVEVATWRKASYSGGSGGACVEVADATDLVLVRDTTNREGGMLRFSAAAWQVFTGELKRL